MFEDRDSCPQDEIDRYFGSGCSHLFSKKLSDKCYILSIAGLPTSDSNIVIGRSDRIAQLYNVSNNDLVLSNNLETDNDIVGVKVCSDNENIFYVGTKNCDIKIWDIRQSVIANNFTDTTAAKGLSSKTLNCFDVSSNNVLISGGTELFACDAYILFWDIRKCNLMGAYWQSHTDDITQLAFNPSNMNQLISGSDDGLINVYDLLQLCEDDALIDSLNTMSSIEKLIWYKNNNFDALCCVTQAEDLQLWKLDDAAPHTVLSRENLTEIIRRQLHDYTYVADVYVDPKYGSLHVLSGSSFEGSKCLRGFSFVQNKVVPTYDFKGNRQIVRCCWYDHNVEVLLTGGENGTLDLWSLRG